MAERFWEQSVAHSHVYIDDVTGRILGRLDKRFSDGILVAYAYGRNVGEYAGQRIENARIAVEVACADFDAAALTDKTHTQADGESE